MNKRKRKRQLDDFEGKEVESGNRDNQSIQKRKESRIERRSLFIRSLPASATNETLTNFFSQCFPVKHAVVVSDQQTKKSRGYGFVTLADAEDAKSAQRSLDKAEWDGRLIRVDIAEPRQREAANTVREASRSQPAKPPLMEPSRLIIRNLPWSIKNSEQLSLLFRSFGKVKFADLPQVKGKLKGFGFVTLRGRKNALKALESLNGKLIDGRTLAVDWAIDKADWEARLDSRQELTNSSDQRHISEKGNPDLTREKAEDKRSSEESKQDLELNADLRMFMDNHFQNLEDEEYPEGMESSTDSEIDSVSTNAAAGEHASLKRQHLSDNASTVFVRNLPFTATDEQLRDFFAHFGGVRYARAVIDKATGKPAGSGFVCFYHECDAKHCLKEAPVLMASAAKVRQSCLIDENADPSGKYTFEGRLLQVVQAVNKEQASLLSNESAARRSNSDKRRLYLLSEGAIGRESPFYHSLSPSDIKMRQASAAQRKKLIQSNPSLHVSLTRLAVRNIPQAIGSKELKKLARDAVVGFAKDVRLGKRQPLSKEENAREGKEAKTREHLRKSRGKGIVCQAKVIYENSEGSKVPERSAAGKSRGYGFIEFVSHRWALMALRYLNGLQIQENEQSRKQRLIVEFAIENSQVVQRRQHLEAKLLHSTKARTNTTQKPMPVQNPVVLEDSKTMDPRTGENNAKKGVGTLQAMIMRKRFTRKRKAQDRA